MPGSTSRDAVSVVIANWNGVLHLARCLDAVFDQTHLPAEVVVVDQGSTDGSRELIQTAYLDVRLIARPNNEGVSRGWNLGIEASASPFILILNTDVFLNRDFLCEALRAISSASDIGSVAAKIYKADTDQIDNVGLFLQRWFRPVNSLNVTQPEFVFAASGSVLLCRREMLDDVRVDGEVFDEQFFAYLEDIDLAWRAQLRGWRCLYAPKAVAHHVGSASHGGRVRVVQKPAWLQRHIWKNRYLILTKNTTPVVLFSLLPFLVVHALFYWFFLLFRLPHRLPTYFLAHIDYIRLLPGVLYKRRWIQDRVVVAPHHILAFFK